MDTYWNHNTAYHRWLLSQVKGRNKVLDVGCGDGLLVCRLSDVCGRVIGIDTHIPSMDKAKQRLGNISNTSLEIVSFEDFQGEANSFDAIIFVASLHHMDLDFCIKKSVRLLNLGGKLLVVGLADPRGFLDQISAICRVMPVKLGDALHKVKGDVGVPVTDPKENLGDIKKIVKKELPGAKIRQALYYRYLLTWAKTHKS